MVCFPVREIISAVLGRFKGFMNDTVDIHFRVLNSFENFTSLFNGINRFRSTVLNSYIDFLPFKPKHFAQSEVRYPPLLGPLVDGGRLDT